MRTCLNSFMCTGCVCVGGGKETSDVWCPGTGDIDDCELPDVGAENQILIFYKNQVLWGPEVSLQVLRRHLRGIT